MRFKTKINVLNTAIQDLQMIAEDDKTLFSKKEKLHREAEITSEVELYRIHFTDSYYDKKRKTYFVCAYVNKDELSQIYTSKINSLIDSEKVLLSASNKENEPFYTVLNYQKAKLYGELARGFIDNLLAILPENAGQYEAFLLEQDKIDELIIAQKRNISFSVSCKEERAKALISGNASILEESNFVYSKKALYNIDVDVSFTEEHYEAGDFVRPNLIISITNKNGKPVESYSKVYPRYSHNNMENSYSLAIVRILQDLDENFLIYYRGF